MKKVLVILLLLAQAISAQHNSKMVVSVDVDKKVLSVNQELTFFNQTNDTLTNIVLNDWMNGYSSKNTPMAARFSDEFERSFHLAKEKERGRTSDIKVGDYTWERDKNHPDVIQIRLRERLLPNQKITIPLSYTVKIPSDKFTKYGYGENGKIYLKNCFLIPARYDNYGFAKYDNLNLDDCANGLSDYEIEISIPQKLDLFSDLNEVEKVTENGLNVYHLSGKNRLDLNLFLDDKKEFQVYKNGNIEVVSDLNDTRLNDIQRAIVVDRIISYVAENLGKFPNEKITVSQTDYDRNPFYG
ncbi:MAG TPA: aminopeptidase, partial [Flavobacterium sp.]|nr:aminopeptidase [Flavobacterium sp.]